VRQGDRAGGALVSPCTLSASAKVCKCINFSVSVQVPVFVCECTSAFICL
jgi:hypothetical protein